MAARSEKRNYDLRNKLARLNVRNRRRPLGVVCIGLATALMGLCGWRLWAFIEERRTGTVEAYLKDFGEPTPLLLSGVAGAACAAIGLFLAIRLLALGISCLTRIGTPANIPGPLADPEQVRRSLTGRVLTKLSNAPQVSERWLNAVIKLVDRRPVSLFFFKTRSAENTLGLGYIPYLIASDSARRVHRATTWLILTLGLYVLLQIRYEEMSEGGAFAGLEILQAMREWPLPALFLWALIVVLVGRVLVYGLLAGKPLEAQVELQSQEVAGAKHPQMIYDYLELSARAIEYDGMPNRTTQLGSPRDANAPGVGETQSFERTLLIEQQPRCLGGMNSIVAVVAMIFAVVLIGYSLYALTNLHATPASTYIGLFATLIGGLVAYKGGTGFLTTALVLYETHRFESIVILADVRGTVTKAKVVVGRGHMDSVMSENETNRSELLITYYAARVETEAESLWAPRFLLSLTVDDQVQRSLHDLRSELDHRVTSGVMIAGVEVGDHHLVDMVQMNVGLRHASRADRALPGSDPALKPALPEPERSEAAEPVASAAAEAEAKPTQDNVHEAVRLRMQTRRLLAQVREGAPAEQSLADAEAFFGEAESYFDQARFDLAIAAYRACAECCSPTGEESASS